MTTLPHPVKQLVTLDALSAICAAKTSLVTRKYDGELSCINVAGAEILAERMRGEISGHFYTAQDRAMLTQHGVFYAALTVASIDGENLLEFGAGHRWRALCELVPQFPPNVILAEVVTDCDKVMASGAEGICAVPWGAPFGVMIAHKAEGIWTCRVTRTGSTQSVGICDAETGADRGSVALRGGKCDQCRVGSIIRVAGMGLTDDGKIRQPVACRNWLVQY